MPEVSSSQQVEKVFISDTDYGSPTWDLDVRVQFTSRTGRQKEIDAFWDGGRVWRVRFLPTEAGDWHYRTLCSDTENHGLHGCEGRFTVEPYSGDNPLYHHGPLKLSRNRCYLIHADGTPFFHLADTAWNGALKAQPEDWQAYLKARREQGFSVVQCVMTQWRAFESEVAFTGAERIEIVPGFFRRLDAKVAAIADHGLISSLVLLWALTAKDPGNCLPEEDCVKLARYIVARYSAYGAIWMLGGDGRYLRENAERWKRIGRAVFSQVNEHVVTLHPVGMEWVGEAFREEPWYNFIGYQSSHGDDGDALNWIVSGPPAKGWKNEPILPVINQEPCYEAHLAYQSKQPFDAHMVRRALYWSLLVSPTAGVTYGHHGIWPWMEERGVPLDHEGSGEAPTWREALESEGVPSLRALRALFSSLEWWKLQPAQELLKEQYGDKNPERFVAVAKAEDDSIVLAYTPEGDVVTLEADGFIANWFDPRTGETRDAASESSSFTPPDKQDWVLLLTKE